MIKRYAILYAVTLLIFMFFLVRVSPASEGHIGATYSQIIDDRSFGATGQYTTDLTDRVKFEADSQIQAGDIIKAKINTDFTFDIARIDLKLLIENKLKGYTLDTLGREQSIGLAFTAPIESLNVDIGIGGKNASPFSAPNAFDTLVGEGFSETAIQNKGLESITPAATGIPFKEGNTLNAFISTNFPLSGFDVDLKGIVELLGEGDKINQAHFNFKRKAEVEGVALTLAWEIGLAQYQETLHYETALITTAGFDF